MARRTKAEAAETRQAIMRAALAVFSKKGFVAATLEEIARMAGVTRGAIYWHFDGKAGLYEALVHEVEARSATVVQGAVAEGGSVVDVLQRVFVRLLSAVEQDTELQATIAMDLFQIAGIPELEGLRRRQLEANAGLLAGITAAVRLAVDDGLLRADLNPQEIARGFLALQNGIILQWLPSPGAFSLSGVAPAMVEIFLRGVLTKG